MVRDISITQARHELTEFPKRLAKDPGPIAITRRGKPVLALLPWEFYESLIETLEIMADPKLMQMLRADIDAIKQGKKIKAVSWEGAKKNLI